MSLRDIGLYPKKEYDYDVNGNLIYEGFTNASASVNDPEWLILKHFYDNNNNRIATRIADNRVKYDKIWTNRNSYNYTTLDNQPPIIDNVIWNDDDHYENNSYTLTINAHDPDNGDSIDDYTVTCNDDNVTVTQDNTNPNVFHIDYPEYTSDTTVTYNITVTDNHGTSISTTLTKLVQNINHPPIIDSTSWDNTNHYENESYTLTINAHDPDSEDTLSYNVTCDDINVTITQDNNNPNIFHIDYPEYTDDTIVTYTITVTDNHGDSTNIITSKLVYNINTNNNNGLFAGGYNAYNTIDYIIISTLGNALDFGDLTIGRYGLAATSNGTNDRGIFGGGYGNSAYQKTIDYVTISTLGDAQDFGDLKINRNFLSATSNSTNDRGVFGGGWNSNISAIDYVTISTLGNAQDFGDLTGSRYGLGATSNSTNNRGVFAGGYSGANLNTIDYITISTLGDAIDFGDLTVNRNWISATSNGTNDRGVFGGGDPTTNTIDYITISTLGDAIDFGDLSISRYGLGATSNGTNDRGVFGGGWNGSVNTIDYITISISNNAQDFGDLTIGRYYLTATSNV